MTPREKAKELVDAFIMKQRGMLAYGYFELAKQCTLIAVEEITEECRDYCDDNFQQDRMSYWQQVKEETERL